MGAIQTQQEINQDDDLRTWGISAQWYTIPEATVNLKMSYQFSKESIEEGETGGAGNTGKTRKARLLVSPINAKYTNTFKVSETLQSELNLKFLPIPVPTRWAEQLTIPDFTGMKLAEAKDKIETIGMTLGNVVLNGVPEDEAVVVSQSPLDGSRAWLTEKAHLWFGVRTQEPESEPKQGLETKQEPEPKPKPEPKLKPETKLKPEPKPKRKPKPKIKSEPEPEPEPETETDNKSDQASEEDK
jgi:hypothetical protein